LTIRLLHIEGWSSSEDAGTSAAGWVAQGSSPGRGKRFFSSPVGADRLCGPLILLFNGYRRAFPGENQPGREVDPSSPSIFIQVIDRKNFNIF